MSEIWTEVIYVLWDDHLQWTQRPSLGGLCSIEILHVKKCIGLTFEGNSLCFSSASTRSELCGVPKKQFTKLDSPPDKALNDKMYKTCLDSKHPSIYICPKEPETTDARKLHQVVKQKLKKIERKEKRKERRRSKIRRMNKRNKKRNKKNRRRCKRKSKMKKWGNGKCKNWQYRKRKGMGKLRRRKKGKYAILTLKSWNYQ